ncbi:unnamed protein product [Lactuca virosa]|uniref:Uncharacterized protein n=1 Tax=Lactuca virosa TaxID=75947 RepID=A0AAU9NT32_9ASTR|nr:unnamed protein product [Lactuca virosa]
MSFPWQGNAIDDYFISVTLEHQIPKGFEGRFFTRNIFTMRFPHVTEEAYGVSVRPDSDTFTLRLPDDWYNDFCGFLICIVTNFGRPHIDIIIKQKGVDEEDSGFEVWQESNTAPEPEYNGEPKTHVGYVSFSLLRHTTPLNSSYNIISFYIHDTYWTSFAAELVPRRNKDDLVQTPKVATDSSEFWDEERDFIEPSFKIKHDSKSCIKILWRA